MLVTCVDTEEKGTMYVFLVCDGRVVPVKKTTLQDCT